MHPATAPKPASPDPEALRFSDFEKSGEMKTCCKALARLISRGADVIEYSFNKQDDTITKVSVKMNYCPGCGRKMP